jgi:hypothetical protein
MTITPDTYDSHTLCRYLDAGICRPVSFQYRIHLREASTGMKTFILHHFRKRFANLLSISSLNKTQERTKSSTGEITVRHYLTETVTAYREEISDHTDVAEINDCHKTLDIHNSSRATTWNPPSITGIGTALRITPLSLKKVSLW